MYKILWWSCNIKIKRDTFFARFFYLHDLQPWINTRKLKFQMKNWKFRLICFHCWQNWFTSIALYVVRNCQTTKSKMLQDISRINTQPLLKSNRMETRKKKQFRSKNNLKKWMKSAISTTYASFVVAQEIGTGSRSQTENILQVPWHATRCGVVSCYKLFGKSVRDLSIILGPLNNLSLRFQNKITDFKNNSGIVQEIRYASLLSKTEP